MNLVDMSHLSVHLCYSQMSKQLQLVSLMFQLVQAIQAVHSLVYCLSRPLVVTFVTGQRRFSPRAKCKRCYSHKHDLTSLQLIFRLYERTAHFVLSLTPCPHKKYVYHYLVYQSEAENIIIIIMGFYSAIYESSRGSDKTSDDMFYGIVQL